MSIGGSSTGDDLGRESGFTSGASQLNAQDTNAAGGSGEDMGQIRQTVAMQMKFQTEMGIIQMIVRMNEALSRMFKSIGESIKGPA